MKIRNLMKVINTAVYELVLRLRSINLPYLIHPGFLVLKNMTDE